MRIARSLLLGVTVALPSTGGAQDIERLFHTAEERNALDARRNGSTGHAVAARTTFEGFVVDERGRVTVWINGAMQRDAAARDRFAQGRDAGRPRPSGAGPGSSGRVVHLRVGAVVEAGATSSRDLVEDGAVAVRR